MLKLESPSLSTKAGADIVTSRLETEGLFKLEISVKGD
jgi:hypothetical protein